MKLILAAALSFSFFACTKNDPSKAVNGKGDPTSMSLAAKAETPPVDPRLKKVEETFATYKRSHIEKSLETLKTVYPPDLKVKGTWKGAPVAAGDWMTNRKKFMNPVKSIEFSGEQIFLKPGKNTYAVIYKENVETFDKKQTMHYGYLETPAGAETHFAQEDISLKPADYERWEKER